MTNLELLEDLDKHLGKINASREAHIQIQAIVQSYKLKLTENPKAEK